MSYYGEEANITGNVSISSNLNVGTLRINSGTITDTSGVVDFGGDNVLTTGNVGIGTDNPVQKLDVNGGNLRVRGTDTSKGYMYITSDNIEIGESRTSDGVSFIDLHSSVSIDFSTRIIRGGGANANLDIINAGTGNMVFATNWTNAMIIDGTGNVGIGITTPLTKLEISGDASEYIKVYNQGTAGDRAGLIMCNDSANNLAGGDTPQWGGFIDWEVGNDDLFIGHYRNYVRNEYITLDSSGNVGIGTSSPQYKCHLDTDSGSGNYGFIHSSGAVNLGTYISAGTNAYMGTKSNHKLLIMTNDSTRMTIDTSGNVGIGVAPNYKLDVYQTANTLAEWIRSTHATFVSNSLIIDVTRANTTAYNFASFRSSAGDDYEFYFRGDGNAYADNTWNGGGADYAEYFESLTGDKIGLGKCVVIDNTHNNKVSKVREYNEDIDNINNIIGVVRAKNKCKGSSIVGNNHDSKWKDKYLTNDYGEYFYEPYDVYEWIDEDEKEHSYNVDDVPDDVIVPDDVKIITLERRIKNPEYNEDIEYISYENRDEKVLVALLGQIPLNVGEPMKKEWIKCYSISDKVDMVYIK